MPMTNECKDCGKKCADKAKRCRQCHSKYLQANKPICSSCSKIVKWGSKRCYECYTAPKFCKYCDVSIKYGNRCEKCYQKERREKVELGNCICRSCEKKIEKYHNSTTECYKCWYKRFYSKQENVKKRQIRCRRWKRKKSGIDLDPEILMEKKKSDGWLTNDGYKMLRIPDHPNASPKNGTIAEHRYIMSKHIGRSLSKTENIHHKNGIRHDNRIENLELWDSSQPSGGRVEDKIEWCKFFLKKHGVKNIE